MGDSDTPSRAADVSPSTDHGITSRAFFATLIVILCLFGYLFWTGYQASRREASINVNNLVDVLASTFESALDRAKSDIRVFAPQITDDDLAGRASEARRADLERQMAYHLREFPAVINYRVFDAKGQTLFGAGSAKPHASFNVADRDWFRQLQADPKRDLSISEVLFGKGIIDQTIIMAVPIRDEEGHFLGAVNAAINLSYFQQLIDRLNIGQERSVLSGVPTISVWSCAVHKWLICSMSPFDKASCRSESSRVRPAATGNMFLWLTMSSAAMRFAPFTIIRSA